MNKRAWSSAIAFASLVSVIGCGDDGTATPGIGAGGASGGSAGTTGAVAGASGGAAVACGAKMCAAPVIPPGMSFGIMPRPPCCADPVMGVCGSLNGAMCMPPLPVAPLCPPGPSFGGTMTTACCTASGFCGVDASMIGMGCFQLSSIPGLGAGMPMTKCDGTVVQPAPAGTGAQTTAGAGGATAGAGGATAGAGGAAAGASGAATGASGAAAGAGGPRAGSGAAGASAGAGAGRGASGRGI